MELQVSDCITFMQNFATNSIDAVVTSPPYNIGMCYAGSSDNKRNYIDFSMRWLDEAIRITRKGVMLNIASKASDRNSLYKLLAEISSKYVIQNEIIWVKSIYTGTTTIGHFKPINSDRYVNNVHEFILHIVEAPVKIDKLAVGVPFTDKSNIARFANKGDKRCRGSTWFVPYETRQTSLAHPATYPIKLAEMMIKYIGATSVLDPFVGSGTTAIAAKINGIEFHGCDISKIYIEEANKRLSYYKER